MLEILFPHCTNELIDYDDAVLELRLISKQKEALCPDCHRKSRRVHSYYQRAPADLPLCGWQMYISLHAKRFRCLNRNCQRATFVETFGSWLSKHAHRAKRYLWHGNVDKVLDQLEDLWFLLDADEARQEPPLKKLRKALDELYRYLENNAVFIVNYGERYRNDETITTAFVESTVNQVISKRFVKKQQMQWSKQGAHLLLQVRTKVLDNELVDVFRGWYAGFRTDAASELKMAA